jgi:integrase
VNGRQHWRSFKTREEAELYLANAQAQKVRGEFRRPTRIRFADFAEEWLRDYARPNVKPRTLETYDGSLRNHLIPEFGELYLAEITRKAIDAFVADWLAGGARYQERLQIAREAEARAADEEDREPRSVRLGKSPGTIANALTPLRKMLGDAVEWEYLATNPAVGVKRPRTNSHGEAMHPLSVEEVGRLLEAVRPEFRTLLLCAVTTGMRLGELRALRWGDIDWSSRRAWVRRSVTNRGVFQEPKSRGSMRAIAMPPTLVSALRLHLMASAWKDEDDLVFPSERGTPLEERNVVRREYKPALRRAGLPQIRFHDLRSTFVSLLIAQGEHPKYISEQVGHASVQITLDRYGHLMPQSYGHAGDRLEAALFGDQPAEASEQPLGQRG